MPHRFIIRFTDGTATVVYAYNRESAKRTGYKLAGSRVIGEVL